MTVDYIAADAQTYDANNTIVTPTTDVALTKPTNLADDDVLLFLSGTNGLVDLSAYPTSFTEVLDYVPSANNSRYRLHVARKPISSAAGEGSSYSFTYTPDVSGRDVSAILSRVTGVDTTTPIDVTYSAGSHSNEGNSSTVTIPAITTNTNGAMVLAVFACINTAGPATSTPSGWTLEAQISSPTNQIVVGLYSKVVATAGVSASTTFSLTGSGRWSCSVLALKPAAGGGGGGISITLQGPTLSLTPGVAAIGEFVKTRLRVTPGIMTVDAPSPISVVPSPALAQVVPGTMTVTVADTPTVSQPSSSRRAVEDLITRILPVLE